MVESNLECNSSTSQPYAQLRSLSVWFCGAECLRQQKLSSSCVHHHIRILQDEFCECRADLFRTDASQQKKRGCLQQKSFSFQFKEKWRARDMQWLSPQASIGCCGLSFSITELIFSGKMPLSSPKKRVKSKKSRAWHAMARS